MRDLEGSPRLNKLLYSLYSLWTHPKEYHLPLGKWLSNHWEELSHLLTRKSKCPRCTPFLQDRMRNSPCSFQRDMRVQS